MGPVRPAVHAAYRQRLLHRERSFVERPAHDRARDLGEPPRRLQVARGRGRRRRGAPAAPRCAPPAGPAPRFGPVIMPSRSTSVTRMAGQGTPMRWPQRSPRLARRALRPAGDPHLAVRHVEGGNEPAGALLRQGAEAVDVAGHQRADHHPVAAGAERPVDRLAVAQAAAELDLGAGTPPSARSARAAAARPARRRDPRRGPATTPARAYDSSTATGSSP